MDEVRRWGGGGGRGQGGFRRRENDEVLLRMKGVMLADEKVLLEGEGGNVRRLRG